MTTNQDFAIQRAHMVDSQIRPNQVNDARIIAAMRILPREAFAPKAALPYNDEDIALGGGRYMPAPMLVARLTQLVMSANPAPNPARVLVIAANSGYGAAVLAQAGAKVTALEQVPGMISPAFAQFAPAAVAVAGALAQGWPAAGPYEAILIEGAVRALPVNLAAQLAAGGRLFAVLASNGVAAGRPGLGQTVMALPSGHGFAVTKVFDCTARLIPELLAEPEFVF